VGCVDVFSDDKLVFMDSWVQRQPLQVTSRSRAVDGMSMLTSYTPLVVTRVST